MSMECRVRCVKLSHWILIPSKKKVREGDPLQTWTSQQKVLICIDRTIKLNGSEYRGVNVGCTKTLVVRFRDVKAKTGRISVNDIGQCWDCFIIIEF